MADIGWAVNTIKKGNKARRPNWSDKGMFIKLQEDSAEMNLPYVWVKTGQDNKVPWAPTQNDLLATDWEEV